MTSPQKSQAFGGTIATGLTPSVVKEEPIINGLSDSPSQSLIGGKSVKHEISQSDSLYGSEDVKPESRRAKRKRIKQEKEDAAGEHDQSICTRSSSGRAEMKHEAGLKNSNRGVDEKQPGSKQKKKRENSDLKRVQGTQNQLDAFRRRQKAIQDGVTQSLSAAGSQSNKLRFDSSSDEERESTNHKRRSGSSPANQKGSGDTSANQRRPAYTNPLFEGSDSESELSKTVADVEKTVEKGLKHPELKEMESGFGGDDRFKMDSRFAEGKKSDKKRKKKNQEDDESQDLEEEKKKEFAVLENILGKSVRKPSEETASPAKNKKKYLGKMTRFDPENPSHYQFEADKQESDESTSEDDEPPKGLDEGSDSEDGEKDGKLSKKVPEVPKSDGSTAKKKGPKSFMDRSFASLLRDRLKSEDQKEAEKKPFSLLESLGLSSAAPEPETAAELHSDSAPVKKAHQSRQNKGCLQETPKSETKQPSKERGKASTQAGGGELFFFAPEDPRLAAAVQSFRRTDRQKSIQKQWMKFRPMLVNSYKKQRREALRRQNSFYKKSDGGVAKKRKKSDSK